MKNIPPPSIQSSALPLVTVVTATYNLLEAGRGGMFRQCAASVQNQDYPAIEHLIIDGGSTDGTLDLIREYEQQGAVRCYSEPDKGIYDAMNKGLARATGKYIAFLNSDDYWHDPGGIRQSVRLLEAEMADFSYAPCLAVAEDGTCLGYCDALLSTFVCEDPYCHQTMLTRTELLRRMGGFNESRKIVADYECKVQLLLMGAKPVYVPLCFTSFRIGGISWNLPVGHDEVDIVHQYLYGPIVGSDNVAAIRQRKLPLHLYHYLLDCVHPTVAREMREHYVCKGAWAYLTKARQYQLQDLPLAKEIPTGAKGKIGAIFPYSVRRGEGELRVLFCGFTLYVDKLIIKKMGSFKRKVLLFGWLPLFKEKTASRRKKGYLLGFIPLYTVFPE